MCGKNKCFRSIQINQPTRCNKISQVYYWTFQHVSGILTPIIRSSTTAVADPGLPLERGGSSAVGRGRAGPVRPRPSGPVPDFSGIALPLPLPFTFQLSHSAQSCSCGSNTLWR